MFAAWLAGLPVKVSLSTMPHLMLALPLLPLPRLLPGKLAPWLPLSQLAERSTRWCDHVCLLCSLHGLPICHYDTQQ